MCRRWRSVYWGEQALWRTFDGAFDFHTWMGRHGQLPASLLAVLEHIGPTADSFALGEIGVMIDLDKAWGHGSWSPAPLLRCLRPQRARAVRLGTEARVL